jgi:hypothetical protein
MPRLQRCCHGHGHESHEVIQGLHLHDASGCKTDMQPEFEKVRGAPQCGQKGPGSPGNTVHVSGMCGQFVAG